MKLRVSLFIVQLLTSLAPLHATCQSILTDASAE